MSGVIGNTTIHFDDRPWSVKAFFYREGRRYEVILPEDEIFRVLGKDTLEQADMLEFFRDRLDEIQRKCNDFIDKRSQSNLPAKDGDMIVIGGLRS